MAEDHPVCDEQDVKIYPITPAESFVSDLGIGRAEWEKIRKMPYAAFKALLTVAISKPLRRRMDMLDKLLASGRLWWDRHEPISVGYTIKRVPLASWEDVDEELRVAAIDSARKRDE